MTALLVAAAAGCRGSTEAPEAGALLLRVSLAPRAPMPDELRLWLFDDTGALWSNQRFPAQGALTPESASMLGTILIQPGTTIGNLRLDLRGLRTGAIAEEALATISPAARAAGVFDVSLSSALPSDGDGDGVPDPIDDCPAVANAAQMGCAAGAGGSGGAHSGVGGGPADDTGGAGGNRGSGGSAGAGGGSGGSGFGGGPGGQGGGAGGGSGGGSGGSGSGGAAGAAGRGGATGGTGGHGGASATLPQGAACAAATQCRSGFCKDGACCDTACTEACNSCATGTCTPITSGEDLPECLRPMSCNKKSKCVGTN